MIVRLCVALCLAASLASKAEVTVENSAYHDLKISFSPNITAENGKLLVDSLKHLLENTSDVLQVAVGLRIASVTFHLPSEWDTSTWENVTIEPATSAVEGDVVVDDVADGAFGKGPFALQYGGCGVPARKILIPTEFLNGPEVFPKGKLLSREWLKYRYGVFDENGFEGDDRHPTYYQIPGTTDVKLTECTHPEVEYYFKDTNGSDCSLQIPFASSDCQIHPEKDTALNATSSLMYFHKELPHLDTVCGKDNNLHKDFTPSKQNLLCNGASIWDVVKSHPDFNKTTTPSTPEDGIQYTYFQETKPRVVVAFENSESLHDQRYMIRFAIRRLIYDLPDGSDFGLYSFNNAPNVVRPLAALPPDNAGREVTIQSSFALPDTDICTTCALLEAVTALEARPHVRASVILIVGSNSSAIDDDIVEVLKTRNLCLTIVAFTKEGAVPTGFEKLLVSSCSSVVELPKVTDDKKTFDGLYQAMQMALPQSSSNTPTTAVQSGTMSFELSLDIPMQPSAGQYTLWLWTTDSGAMEKSSIQCATVNRAVELNTSVTSPNVVSYTFEPVEDEVKCKLGYQKLTPVFTQVEMRTKPGEFFDGEAWIHDTSESINEQMPVIVYARINFGSYPVQGANVMASVIGPNGETPKPFSLLDSGLGDPDITQYDGIYSGYFVDFIGEGEYTVTVTAEGDGNSTRVGSNGEDHCCGSKVRSTSAEARPLHITFSTSFLIKGAILGGGYKPSRILDLRVARFDPTSSIILKWTSPGGNADKERSRTYHLKYFTTREDTLNNFDKGLSLNVTIDPERPGREETCEILLGDLQRDATYYLAMRSVNEYGKESDISNVLELYFPEDQTTVFETSTDPSPDKQSGTDKKTIGIIIGVLVLAIVVIIVIYAVVYFLRRPKKAESKKRGGSDRNNTSPPIGLNSIPADVIIRHHNEVVSAKSQHKDPPIFKEENMESIDLTTESPKDDNRNGDVEYSEVDKRQPVRESTYPEVPPKSPKRMTNV